MKLPFLKRKAPETVPQVLGIVKPKEIVHSSLKPGQDLHIYIELMHRPSGGTPPELVKPAVQLEQRYWKILDVLYSAGFRDIFLEGPTDFQTATRFDAANSALYQDIAACVETVNAYPVSRSVQQEELERLRFLSGDFPFFYAVEHPGVALWGAENCDLRSQRSELDQERKKIMEAVKPYMEKTDVRPEDQSYVIEAAAQHRIIMDKIKEVDVQRGIAAVQNLADAVRFKGITRSVLFFGAQHRPEIQDAYESAGLSYAIFRLREIDVLEKKILDKSFS